MKLRICVFVAFLCAVLPMAAQTPGSNAVYAQVPPVIQFANVATSEAGSPLTGTVKMTFSLYNNAQGGEALWSETQNISLDETGHYSAYVGITKTEGVPMSLFTNGQAHWLGVQVAGQTEQPRVFLVSVPYAMKAGDAATIGGLPPSAFVRATPGLGEVVASGEIIPAGGVSPNAAVTGTGTAGYVPMWDSATDIIDSVLYQTGSGSTAKIGINTLTPATTLDVKGGATLRGATSVMGALTLPASGTATAAAGKGSQVLKQVASAYNSSTSTAVGQTFEWQAEPINNDTSSASGTLNLLFGQGTAAPAQTGLQIASNGRISFAAGQTFPGTGTGNGTVTSVGSGLGLTGGPITSSGALSINTSVVPQLAANNAFTGNQSISGSLSASGAVSGASLVGSTGSIASNLSVGTGSTYQPVTIAGTIGFTGGTGTQPPLIMNADTCCNSGNRMFWAHSPEFPTWGIYYDDSLDTFHWQTAQGTDTMTVAMGGNVGVNHNLTVGGTINGGRGILITELLGNASLSGATSGYFNMISDYVPPVNATAMIFNRCAIGATAAGQILSFRSAVRTPTASGTVTVGNAFYLEPSSAGTETIYDENNDFFPLTAGNSYDFGMNFASSSVAGFGFCSTTVQIFSN